MKLLLLLLLFFFTKNVFSQEVKIQSYKQLTYNNNDTLRFSAQNISSKKIKISFSIDLFYKGKWREIDNDIFQNKSKQYHYFYLLSNCTEKFDFPVAFIDSNYLKEIKTPKFRIVMNIYEIHPFKLSKYNLNEFIINNTK